MFIHTDTGNLDPPIFLVLKNPRVVAPDLRKILCRLVAQQYRINLQCKIELGCDPCSGNPPQILACEMPLTEDPEDYSPCSRKRVRHNLVTKQQQHVNHSGSVRVSVSEEAAI